MIRVVLSCLLVVAVAGVVFPAADAARADSTATHVETTADEIASAASELVADEDPAPAGLAGPTRRVTISVPRESWKRIEVSSLTIRGGTHLELVAHTATGTTTARRVDVPRIRPVDGVLELEPGEQRLTLTLRGDSTAPVVVIDTA
ncbi:hypothetical protein ACFQJC_12680 [Haloferax namakaokahaiae]|uniref:DUF7311 domain-containing protein n=1 Tax=Haloferax namakaokahaiae TaxID=1748331 RepID=A0ABD5ZGH8_9EURY